MDRNVEWFVQQPRRVAAASEAERGDRRAFLLLVPSDNDPEVRAHVRLGAALLK
jgi:hypothetical protein